MSTADAPVIPSSVTFDVNDPETFSASAAVTFLIIWVIQNRQQFYIKTQNPDGADQTFKFDTKMFVDGEEIKPDLTRATDIKGTAQFIDKFGQKQHFHLILLISWGKDRPFTEQMI